MTTNDGNTHTSGGTFEGFRVVCNKAGTTFIGSLWVTSSFADRASVNNQFWDFLNSNIPGLMRYLVRDINTARLHITAERADVLTTVITMLALFVNDAHTQRLAAYRDDTLDGFRRIPVMGDDTEPVVELADALRVIVWSSNTRQHLEDHDPKALAQADAALVFAGFGAGSRGLVTKP